MSRYSKEVLAENAKIRFSLRRKQLERTVVKNSQGCWLWPKAVNHDGYGVTYFKRGDKIETKAHRVSYIIYKGEIPDDYVVLHSCDNPSCVNPDHLRIGTQLDNIADMLSKGRQAKQEINGNAKLTALDVVKIRSWRKLGYSYRRLAEIFGISKTQIIYIVKRIYWKNV